MKNNCLYFLLFSDYQSDTFPYLAHFCAIQGIEHSQGTDLYIIPYVLYTGQASMPDASQQQN